MPRRLKAILLALLLLDPTQQAWRAGATLAVVAGIATEALAQARRSSGGYSRPGGFGGGYSRLPSTSGPRVRSRTPSTGGYSLPGTSGIPSPRRPSVGGSSWDRAQTRERSAGALEQMRRQQAPPPARPGGTLPQGAPQGVPQGAPQGDGTPWWRQGGTIGGSGWGRSGGGGGWYRDRGWSLPGGFPGMGQRSFGIWDGLFLWFLLNNLSRPGSTDFFHNHRDDPGYRDWRTEVEARAQQDPEVRQRLDELDRQLAGREDQPRDPNYLPPDVPPEVALAPERDARTPGVREPDEGGGGLPGAVLLGGGVALALLLWRRRRQRVAAAAGRAPGGHPSSGRVPDVGGSAAKRSAGGDGGAGTRVGMVITLDPTPFLLAAGSIKVPPPSAAATGELRLSVEAVGRIAGPEGAELRRLYLPPGGDTMVELHLDGRGRVELARYFATIDEVTPADPEEWGAWLDPREGMIGWPEFQTRDGKRYARAWSPGSERTPPVMLDETIEALDGMRQRRSQAMLYAAPSGAAAPAPETEYILVSAIQEGNAAWVEIRAGIDINPASLSLV
jgi:hypothetical protein